MMALTAPQRILLAIVGMLALIGVGIVIGAWLCTQPPKPAGEWQPAQPDKRIADTGTETVKPKDCAVVVAGRKAKGKLALPPAIVVDDTQHVTSASIIPSSERPQSLVTLFSTTTGQTQAHLQPLAYPWLATEQRGQIWAGLGLTTGGQTVGRILLREDLLQIRAIHLGLMGEVDTAGRWFGGVGLAYRW